MMGFEQNPSRYKFYQGINKSDIIIHSERQTLFKIHFIRNSLIQFFFFYHVPYSLLNRMYMFFISLEVRCTMCIVHMHHINTHIHIMHYMTR